MFGPVPCVARKSRGSSQPAGNAVPLGLTVRLFDSLSESSFETGQHTPTLVCTRRLLTVSSRTMADQNRPEQSSPDSAEKTVEKKQLDISAVNQSDAIDRKSSEDKP